MCTFNQPIVSFCSHCSAAVIWYELHKWKSDISTTISELSVALPVKFCPFQSSIRRNSHLDVHKKTSLKFHPWLHDIRRHLATLFPVYELISLWASPNQTPQVPPFRKKKSIITCTHTSLTDSTRTRTQTRQCRCSTGQYVRCSIIFGTGRNSEKVLITERHPSRKLFINARPKLNDC